MATIKEIAEAAGVSTSAVSRVLNHDTTLSLSKKKRQAILEIAEKFQYQTPRKRKEVSASEPATSAKVLVSHHTSSEDVLVDPYYLAVRLGIEVRLRELGFAPIVQFKGAKKLDRHTAADIAGVIAVGDRPDTDIEKLKRQFPHFVAADFLAADDDVDGVVCDLGTAMQKLVAHLLDAGFRRIAYVGAFRDHKGELSEFGEARCKGYVDALKEAGLFEPAMCRTARGISVQNGYDLTCAVLESSTPDVLIAVNDSMAIGAYRAILEKGLKIPDDISVIGFNDIPAAEFLVPSLSTVKIFAEHIGIAAVDLLRERIEGREFAKHVSVTTAMVWRESTRFPG